MLTKVTALLTKEEKELNHRCGELKRRNLKEREREEEGVRGGIEIEQTRERERKWE